MVEVNEEIVKQYLELKGYFVMTDTKYLKPKEETGKKSSGWGDVDILAIHPNGSKYLIEVKGWHMESFTPSYFGLEPYVDTWARKKAEEIFHSKEFKTVLVVPEIGSRSQQRVTELAKAEGIDEIWDFPTILKYLINHVELNIDYDSEVLHMIRILKQYLFLPQRLD
jgi:Nuclease-related domain